uniref:Uncharacterized protein n=1 Tax=Cannabis sativa TaxID=3483 RepID=A0A803NUA7_CANSA
MVGLLLCSNNPNPTTISGPRHPSPQLLFFLNPSIGHEAMCVKAKMVREKNLEKQKVAKGFSQPNHDLHAELILDT